MKYKIGDEVRVKNFDSLKYSMVTDELRFYSGVITKIVGIEGSSYLLACDGKFIFWNEDLITSINYTCRICGKVFHTKHGYYVHKSFHKCGRINNDGILNEKFKKKTSKSMAEKLSYNNSIKPIGIIDNVKYTRVGIKGIGRLFKTSEEKYTSIMNWLYTNGDSLYYSRGRHKFSTILKKILKDED